MLTSIFEYYTGLEENYVFQRLITTIIFAGFKIHTLGHWSWQDLAITYNCSTWMYTCFPDATWQCRVQCIVICPHPLGFAGFRFFTHTSHERVTAKKEWIYQERRGNWTHIICNFWAIVLQFLCCQPLTITTSDYKERPWPTFCLYLASINCYKDMQSKAWFPNLALQKGC